MCKLHSLFSIILIRIYSPITRFPSNSEVRAKWLKPLNKKDWVPKKTSRICSDHFEEAFIERGGKTVKLKFKAVPTRFKVQEKVFNLLYTYIRLINVGPLLILDTKNFSLKNTFKLDQLCNLYKIFLNGNCKFYFIIIFSILKF